MGSAILCSRKEINTDTSCRRRPIQRPPRVIFQFRRLLLLQAFVIAAASLAEIFESGRPDAQANFDFFALFDPAEFGSGSPVKIAAVGDCYLVPRKPSSDVYGIPVTLFWR